MWSKGGVSPLGGGWGGTTGHSWECQREYPHRQGQRQELQGGMGQQTEPVTTALGPSRSTPWVLGAALVSLSQHQERCESKAQLPVVAAGPQGMGDLDLRD